MRLSTLSDSPYFDPQIVDRVDAILLDAEPVQHAVECDDAEGWVDVLVLDPTTKTGCGLERKRGRVEVVVGSEPACCAPEDGERQREHDETWQRIRAGLGEGGSWHR